VVATSQSDLQRIVRQNNDTFEANIRQQDAGGLASAFYTDDALVMPQDQPSVQGMEQIKQFWQGMFGAGLQQARLETERLETSGDLAVEIGRYILTIKPEGTNPVEAKGKYIVVLRRQPDGAWKAMADMFSSNAPAA
jgi:ketosteroid isomerase-like protein